MVVSARWRRLTRRWLVALAVAASVATASGINLALPNKTGSLKFGELKLGALSTAAGALVALSAARILRVGRFTATHGGNLHEAQMVTAPAQIAGR